MSDPYDSSSNKSVSSGQVRSLAAIWVVLTLVVGAGTFVGLFWVLGGFDNNEVEMAKGHDSPQSAEQLARGMIASDELAVTESLPMSEPAVAEITVDPTEQLVDSTAIAPVVSATDTMVPVPTPTLAVVESNEEDVVDTPEPTVTTAPVVSGSTQFSLGGQVIHGGLLAIDKMQAMKMSWVKLQNYDLGGATVEGDIQNAHNNGLKILVSIKDNAGHTRIASPDYQEQFIQYLERVATLGADAIEVWNAPNLDREWPADQMGGANYTELLKKAYPRIKAANPNTMVISAALSPTGAFSGGCGSIGSVYGCDDKPFLQDMVNAGALNYLDCVGMHYNEGLLAPSATSGDPRGNSGHYTRYFRGMLDTYGAILGGARSICLTEIGYLSGEEWGYLPSAFSWNPASPVNMSVAQHADYLGQAVTLARQTGNIRLMIIFNVDFAILKSMEDDPQAGYSLIRPNQSCPACSIISAAMP